MLLLILATLTLTLKCRVSEAVDGSSPVNITSILLDAHDFNVAASMLQASSVAAEFEGYEHGVGITVFVPTDQAFATSDHIYNTNLRSLPADKKALLLKFHALHSYYPLGSLHSIVNPVHPTLATEDTAAGLYTLNITRLNGSVAIGTALVQAAITRTVFDQNPLAIFAVSKVLLPKELFTATAAAPVVQLAGTAPPAMGPGADGVVSPVSTAVRKGKGTSVQHSYYFYYFYFGLTICVLSICQLPCPW